MATSGLDRLRLRAKELDRLDYANLGDLERWHAATSALLKLVLANGHWAPVEFDSLTPARMSQAGPRGLGDARRILDDALEGLGVPEPPAGDTDGTVAVVLTQAERGELEVVIGRLHMAIQDGAFEHLDPDSKAELDADVAALDVQARSPRPKRAIVKAALAAVGTFIAGVASSNVAGELQPLVDRLLSRL